MTTMHDHWDELVSVAMLGTDRRNPPDAPDPIADLVDDTVRANPSERMLAQVAAAVASRRAGVLPGPVAAPLAPPEFDDRPVLGPVAADRWYHVVASWPVLEDEWMLAVVTNGWRLPPELVTDVLVRHRSDAVRRARAHVAAGPLAGWMVGHVPELAGRGAVAVDPESLAELPALPIPPDLEALLTAPGTESSATLRSAIETGALVHAHRAVLINLVARMRTDALGEVAAALEGVEQSSPGFALAAVLADLAATRRSMLVELATR